MSPTRGVGNGGTAARGTDWSGGRPVGRSGENMGKWKIDRAKTWRRDQRPVEEAMADASGWCAARRQRRQQGVTAAKTRQWRHGGADKAEASRRGQSRGGKAGDGEAAAKSLGIG